jgi:hypothetical protein
MKFNSNFFNLFSYGHSLVLWNYHIYTYMKQSVYKFPVPYLLDEKKDYEWTLVSVNTSTSPAKGLINYGIEVTEKGKLILYGGLTETQFPVDRNRTFTVHGDLWLLNLLSSKPEFQECNWKYKVGGYSKILSIGRELTAVLNTNFPEKILLLDVEEMKSYTVRVSNDFVLDKRIGYGLSSLNSNTFIIGGGYIQSTDLTVSEIAPEYHLCVMTFSRIKLNSTDQKNSTETITEQAPMFKTAIYATLVFNLVLIITIILILLKRKKMKKKKGKTSIQNPEVMSHSISMEKREERHISKGKLPKFDSEQRNVGQELGKKKGKTNIQNPEVISQSISMEKRETMHISKEKLPKFVSEHRNDCQELGSSITETQTDFLSGKSFACEIFEKGHLSTDSNNTKSLTYSPLKQPSTLGEDFAMIDGIAKKELDTYYRGLLMSPLLIKENDENTECVVKIEENDKSRQKTTNISSANATKTNASDSSNDANQLLREICIYEYLSINKYFEKLLGYSTFPAAVVTKYYPFGTLEQFVFSPKKHPSIPVKCSLKIIY